MSRNRLILEGLDDLRAALRALPDELASEAGPMVVDAAEAAASDIRGGYPHRTGDLADKVVVTQQPAGRYGTGAAVRNTSKLASIFENGTQARHTKLGANRGSMPPGHVFVPPIIRHRRLLTEQVKALLEQHGLMVDGDAL